MVGEIGESGQNVQISNYKINESWGCNVDHGYHIFKNFITMLVMNV